MNRSLILYNLGQDASSSQTSLTSQLRSAEKLRSKKLLELECLEAKIRQLEAQLEAGGQVQSDPDEEDWRPDASCAVCLSVPRHKAYTCRDCDGLLCAGCRSGLARCPCCRADFDRLPPVRNRWAERLVVMLTLQGRKAPGALVVVQDQVSSEVSGKEDQPPMKAEDTEASSDVQLRRRRISNPVPKPSDVE